ncbi:hypothetical protein A2U01_0069154, partial [Trifolium medium]|nr:hypothetical protein [Trifolium medium]
RKIAAWYSMVGDKLYKRGFASPMLLCVGEREARRIMEETHEGSCGSHIGARSLVGKILRAGFFWPNVYDDTPDMSEAAINANVTLTYITPLASP